MDRYNLAFVLIILALAPLVYVNIWFGVAAAVVFYGLIARLAHRDLDRQRWKHTSSMRQLRIKRHHEIEKSLHA